MRFLLLAAALVIAATVTTNRGAADAGILAFDGPRVVIREFKLPFKGHSWGLYGIAAGPDKAIWFTTVSGNGKSTFYGSAIGRISADGKARLYYLTPSADPQGIAAGPDGALWFTEYNGNKIGRITATGAIKEFALPESLELPLSITSGVDGALWFTAGGALGRITTAGAVTQYNCNVKQCYPYDITVGPDGTLWSTDDFEALDRYSFGTGSRTVTQVAALSGFPAGIITGPDGALWFCEAVAGQIGRYQIGDGGVREYGIPGGQKSPNSIAVGSDDALWFTLAGFGIGRIDLSGHIAQYPTPSGNPYEIVKGADDALWFTNAIGNTIGRASLR